MWEEVDKTVPILNNTRCGVFNLSSWKTWPYCHNYLDQTNCTDENRVGGHCYINGYWSSVSKYVTCGSDFKLTDKPVDLCDDNLENECLSPTEVVDCVIHKHQLCDGYKDCSDGSDEANDNCSRTTGSEFKCARTFNANKHMEIPVSWLFDNQTDCINGEDENSENQWTVCGEIDAVSYTHLTLPTIYSV